MMRESTTQSFPFPFAPGKYSKALTLTCRDLHPREGDWPVMLGCIVAISKITKENGATQVIPGSHVWGPERAPEVYEAIPAELEIGDALLFLGNTYHGGGANITKYVKGGCPPSMILD